MKTFLNVISTLFSLIVLSTSELLAQLSIVSTTPVDNALNVPLTTTLTVTFSATLDTNLQKERFKDWNFSNIDSGTALSFTNEGKTFTAQVYLEANTAYFVAVWFAKAADGSTLQSPFVFHFTTGSSFPSTSVSGTISSETTGISPENSIIVLSTIDIRNTHSEGPPPFAAWGTVNGDGTFLIPNVPNGTYWPIAAKDVNNDGEASPNNGIDVVALGDSVVINNTSVINVTLIFFQNISYTPKVVTRLPELTMGGWNPSIASDGSSIYLYEQDYMGASSAKVFKVNPYTGSIFTTYNLMLNSLIDGISWIGRMTFHKGNIWVTGGYGWSQTLPAKEGVFKIDLTTSKSSNQIPAGSGFDNLGGIASDGTNLYASVDLMGTQTDLGIVKFDPLLVSEVPTILFSVLDGEREDLCFGGGYIWAGIDDVKKIATTNGAILESLNLPPSAAQLYLDDMLWMYDRDSNMLIAYDANILNVRNEQQHSSPSSFYLYQNYPNLFNPVTTIEYQIPKQSFVTLKIFDLLGREGASLVNEDKSAGRYSVQWDATSFGSGIYFYLLSTNGKVKIRKMVLMR